MVMRQTLQLVVPQAITAAVAYVGYPGTVAAGSHGHQCCSHARPRRILRRAMMHAMVGRVDGLLEGFEGEHALVHGAKHGVHREPAGDFPRSRAPHAIANHKIAGALAVAEIQAISVLVGFPGSPLIGRTGRLVLQHRLLILWHLPSL